MKAFKFSDAVIWWAMTGISLLFWIGSILIFSDLCLSFGGGDNSGCESHFNYSEFWGLIAIFYTVSGPIVIIFLALISSILSAMKYFSTRRADSVEK